MMNLSPSIVVCIMCRLCNWWIIFYDNAIGQRVNGMWYRQMRIEFGLLEWEYDVIIYSVKLIMTIVILPFYRMVHNIYESRHWFPLSLVRLAKSLDSFETNIIKLWIMFFAKIIFCDEQIFKNGIVIYHFIEWYMLLITVGIGFCCHYFVWQNRQPIQSSVTRFFGNQYYWIMNHVRKKHLFWWS